MLNKKFMILTIIIISLLTVSVVSAEDNATNDVISVENNQEIIANESDVGTFDELSSLIENTPEGTTLELNQNYQNDGSVSEDGITIAKAITIDGKGHTLDANSKSRIFNITVADVTLKNIVFKNGYIGNDSCGGAVFFNGTGNVTNCNFNNNSANYGGAVYFEDTSTGIFENCNFTNNFAGTDIGAIYMCSGTVSNCIFINNAASNCEGAIRFENGNVTNCNFTNNSATYAGAMRFYGTGNVTNCNFVNNTVSSDGGAIWGDEGIVKNCNFVNNRATHKSTSEDGLGGAIELNSGSVENCNFTNNSDPQGHGGAIFFWDEGNVTNCNFVNNTVSYDGSAVFFWRNGVVTNCNFVDNSARSGAIVFSYGDGKVTNCSFTNNNATSGGAINFCRFGEVTNCSFTNNNATSGGAIYFFESGTVENCSFTNNNATSGGAIYFFESGTVENCSFTNNNATNGGAVYLRGNGNVTNSNFADNSATGEGSAVYFSDDGLIKNSLFKESIDSVYGGTIINCTFNEISFKNFSDLSSLIESTPGNGILELDCDYCNVDSVLTDGITITKAITIDGKGHTLDANNKSRIFDIGASVVTLKNIIFKNGYHNELGGAITGYSIYDCIINNCTFVNCTSHSGGAILWPHDNSAISNCSFVNCSAQFGGAINWQGDNGVISNCRFVNCYSNSSGGGIYFNALKINISYCSFVNCSTNEVGGAITGHDDEGIISDCSFVNCSSNGHGGGAIDWSRDNCVISNSSFVNCSSYGSGGAIYWQGSNDTVFECSFVNCYSDCSVGGAIYWNGDNSTVYGCSFVNCSSNKYEGGAIYLGYNPYCSNNIGSVYGCSFVNCSALKKGGAINWVWDNCIVSNSSFVNCSTNESGGAIYWKGDNCTVNNTSFNYSNANSDGGAIYWKGMNGNIENSNFRYSHAKNGGAVYAAGVIPLMISKSKFENNTADELGGAIYFGLSSMGNVSDCNFVNCSANTGGAIYVSADDEYDTMIISSTFDNNKAKDLSGAVFGGNITNCTFIENNGSIYSPKNTTTVIVLNSSELLIGKNQTIVILVLDESNQPIEGNVEVFINSTSIGSKTIGAPFTYVPVEIGNYIVEARFSKTSDYAASSNSTSFTVITNVDPTNLKNETRTMLLVNSANVYLGDNVTVTAIVSNQNSEMLSGTVDVYVNSTFIGSKNINEAFAYAPVKLGKYVIEAMFNETSDYNASSASVAVNVIENVVPEEIISDDDGIVILEFPDDAGGEVEVFIDGVSVEVVKIVNGIAVIDLSKYKGNYTVSFVYSGDDKYSGFTRESNVTVNVNTASINAKDTKVLYTAGQKFSVTVYEDENMVAKSTPVEFKVNGKYFKTYNTNDNGIASFKVTQTPGTYNVQATALGKTVTKTLTVKHLVTLKKVTVKRSAKKLVLTATLAKVNKKYLKNKKVTFKFNGKKYTAKTNKKGVAKVTIKASVLKKLKAGKKITYQATYLKDTVKQNVKVKK